MQVQSADTYLQRNIPFTPSESCQRFLSFPYSHIVPNVITKYKVKVYNFIQPHNLRHHSFFRRHHPSSETFLSHSAKAASDFSSVPYTHKSPFELSNLLYKIIQTASQTQPILPQTKTSSETFLYTSAKPQRHNHVS